MDQTVEQIRALIHSEEWETMTDQDKGAAIKGIDDDADVYSVSFLSAKGDGSQYTTEEYATLDEALERAHAVYGGAEPLYAGSYVDVIDFGGESYMSMYTR